VWAAILAREGGCRAQIVKEQVSSWVQSEIGSRLCIFRHTIVTISTVFPTVTLCPAILNTQQLRLGDRRRRRNYSDGTFLETKMAVIVPEEVHKVDVRERVAKSIYINAHN
jgi:hypothetical protein